MRNAKPDSVKLRKNPYTWRHCYILVLYLSRRDTMVGRVSHKLTYHAAMLYKLQMHANIKIYGVLNETIVLTMFLTSPSPRSELHLRYPSIFGRNDLSAIANAGSPPCPCSSSHDLSCSTSSELWSFPSFYHKQTHHKQHLISMIGCTVLCVSRLFCSSTQKNQKVCTAQFVDSLY